MTWGLVTLITLTLIDDFLDLGFYSAVVAAVGVAISYALGKYSDKLKSKKNVLMWFAILNGIFTSFFMFDFLTTSLLWWGVLNIVWGKVDQLFDQTALAFIMDETSDRLKTVFGREILLNVGRFAGMLAVALGFFFPENLYYVIASMAFAMFIYAFCVRRMASSHDIYKNRLK